MIEGVLILFVEPPLQKREPPQTVNHQPERQARNCGNVTERVAVQVVSPLKREFISTVFLVKKKEGGGGNRPVINLKQLNSFVHYQHFKVEALHFLKHLIQKGDWMIKIGIKDAYFTVQIDPQHQPFLPSIYEAMRYHFLFFPFGLGPAPFLFIKLLKPAVALLRRLGRRLIIYLDDIIVFLGCTWRHQKSN